MAWVRCKICGELVEYKHWKAHIKMHYREVINTKVRCPDCREVAKAEGDYYVCPNCGLKFKVEIGNISLRYIKV